MLRLPAQLRKPRTKEKVAAAYGAWRNRVCHRNDRTGHGKRSAGYSPWQKSGKLGHLSSDTSELFFDEVRVPVSNLLGAEGGAMGALMSELPQERLTIALHSIAAAQKAFDL